MADFEGSRTAALSRALAEARLRAQQHLWSEMEKRGMGRDKGWTIVELTREAHGGTEIVMRPMHMRLAPPDDLECVVAVTDEAPRIDTDCRTGDNGAPPSS